MFTKLQCNIVSFLKLFVLYLWIINQATLLYASKVALGFEIMDG